MYVQRTQKTNKQRRSTVCGDDDDFILEDSLQVYTSSPKNQWRRVHMLQVIY